MVSQYQLMKITYVMSSERIGTQEYMLYDFIYTKFLTN